MITNKYIESLNESYKRTNQISAFDGYTGDTTVSMFGYKYVKFQYEEYNQIFRLIENLETKTIFDCGCGAGSLLNFLINKKNMIPYGIDANDLAIRVLKSKVLPGYRENFLVKDFLVDEININTDICMIMTTYLLNHNCSNFTINSKYIIVRASNLKNLGNNIEMNERINHFRQLYQISKNILQRMNIRFKKIDFTSRNNHTWFLFRSY